MRPDYSAITMPGTARRAYIILICCRIYSYDATGRVTLQWLGWLNRLYITNCITNFATGVTNYMHDNEFGIRNGRPKIRNS
jgi:hypothetical protein